MTGTPWLWPPAIVAPTAPIVSGSIIQVARATSLVRTSTGTLIPMDDTIPQNTEGVAYGGLDTIITPRYANSSLLVRVFVPFTTLSNIGQLIGAVFRDAGADAIATNTTTYEAVNRLRSFECGAIVPAVAVAPTTFKFRYGSGTPALTAYLLMSGAAAGYYGTTAPAIMTVAEIAA